MRLTILARWPTAAVVGIVLWVGIAIIFVYEFLTVPDMRRGEGLLCTLPMLALIVVTLSGLAIRVIAGDKVREVITVDPAGITLDQQPHVLPLGFPKHYAASKVGGLGLVHQAIGTLWLSHTYAEASAGVIRFQYDGKEKRFGIMLDKNEALEILEAIVNRFPQYGDSNSIRYKR